MKVSYDADVDAVYLELLKSVPEGVIEIAEGIRIDVTSDGRIVGIELLDASKKVCRWHRHARRKRTLQIVVYLVIILS
jgi:uncharacterized protein YuzE